MTGHVLWPEGRPDEAARTSSWWKANLLLLRMQVAYLFPLTKARRIRHATSTDGYVDPVEAETALQAAGAIPPPGGWPEPAPASKPEGERPTGTVQVTTHSVI
jgi:hypothetical protein